MIRLFQRISALFLILALLPATVYAAPTAEDGALLPKVAAYEGQFADLEDANPVFFPYIAASFEYGLFVGRGGGFAPNASITIAELLTLSARIHAAYADEAIPAGAADEPWYAPYVSYLAERELLSPALPDYDAVATRAQLAAIFALSLPEECFDNRNALLVTDAYASGGFIADVEEYTPNQPQILWLYRQGILVGTDGTGSFWPDKPASRAEVAAVVTRMVDPALRITLDWAIPPAWSVDGTTLAGLIDAPEGDISHAPSYNDDDAIDTLIRQMLAANEASIALEYRSPLTGTDANTLSRVFSNHVKTYCEQMYNSVNCTYYRRSGRATLFFSAGGVPGDTEEARAAQLAQYRELTMAKAIEIHDTLWETGLLTADMSEYEIAETYYIWLCNNCAYDHQAAENDSSLSHLAYSALILGNAVCDGYTGAYNLLLKLEGIECSALPDDDIHHIWTVATLDGTEYHIDVTWGDQISWVDMDYFGMSAAQSEAVHVKQS